MAKINQTMNNTLSSDLAIRPEFLGFQTLLSPFVQHTATQRLMMHASESAQAVVLNEGEFPRIATGYEEMVGSYEFSTCRLDQDIVVRKIIPKFNPINLQAVAEEIPSWIIVYMGMTDHKIHSMEVCRYTFLHEGFGYYNQLLGFDNDLLFEGSYIPKGTKLTTSPSHKGHMWSMGLNANTIYLTMWGVTEDAFVVSKSFARKGRNLAIKKLKLNIGLDEVPLNLYGTDGKHKCFPSIGETVRDDGVLIALRKINKSTFVADMTPSSLRTIEQLHDQPHRAPIGSKVIDVDVYINSSALKKMKEGDHVIYEQFINLLESHKYQQDAILKAYRELCEKENIQCAPEFNTAVFNAATLSNCRDFVPKDVKLLDGREPVEFITVEITFAYTRDITVGSKLAGRDGSKGVVAAIWDDENMPVDEYGVRADLVMTPASVINRMNPSQMYEQFWNRVALQVIRNCKQRWLGGYVDDTKRDWLEDVSFRENWRQIFNYIVDFLNDFRPAYAKFIAEETVVTDNDRKKFVEACLNDGIYLIAGFTDPVDPNHIIEVAKKHGVEESHITYREKDPETGELQTITTIDKALIGSKYVMLLGKIPSDTISAVEIGYVSQFELPIKLKSKHMKSQSVVSLTPMKFGEDETCILSMSIGAEKVARTYAIHASAPEVVKEMAKTLITAYYPTQLLGLEMHTQDIIDRNQNVSMLAHMAAVCGYDITKHEN